MASAWLLGILSLLLALGTVVLGVLNSVDPQEALDLLFFLSCVLVGCLITLNQPRSFIGWFMLGGGFSFLLMSFTGHYALYGLVTSPGSLPAARLLAWPETWLWIPGSAGLFLLLPLYFPSGELPSPRWHWLARSIVVGAIVVAFLAALSPGTNMIQVQSSNQSIVNPVVVPETTPILSSLTGWIDTIVPLCEFVLLCGVATSLVVRFRRSTGVERQQMKWLTYAIFGLPIAIALQQFIQVGVPLAGIWLLSIPAAVGIAILRYSLYDIDLIINRTIVYGALSACVAGIYIFIVAYLGSVLQLSFGASSSRHHLIISLSATGVVAVLFQPIREHLQRGVNRLTYGDRDEPYAVISRLGERLESSLAASTVLQTIVETVRDALKLPYVAIALESNGSPVIVAAAGTERATTLRLRLAYQQEPVGELLLAQRTGSDGFSPADQRLLADLARQIGVAAHNVRLTEQTLRLNRELQHSREQLVIGREEERRRLRRELHDGLAPTLAALNLKAGVIRNTMSADLQAAETLTDQWRAEIHATIRDVRRLAYELRPPVLDELGLVAAIQERASHANSAELYVTVEAPASLQAIPAAVEVAAFRIVQEALINVERHARARNVRVRLWTTDTPGPCLCLEVVDDGIGPRDGTTFKQGVGLLTMRERAEELGGTLLVGGRPHDGTRVAARLPLEEED